MLFTAAVKVVAEVGVEVVVALVEVGVEALAAVVVEVAVGVVVEIVVVVAVAVEVLTEVVEVGGWWGPLYRLSILSEGMGTCFTIENLIMISVFFNIV